VGEINQIKIKKLIIRKGMPNGEIKTIKTGKNEEPAGGEGKWLRGFLHQGGGTKKGGKRKNKIRVKIKKKKNNKKNKKSKKFEPWKKQKTPKKKHWEQTKTNKIGTT